MTLPVFWSDGLKALDGGVGDTVELTGEEGRHAVVVRRLRVGERLVLTDGAGTTATCRIDRTGRDGLDATVHEVTHHPRPTPELTVVQAIAKGDRGELAVELLTEIGVDRIVPWAAERCVAVWRGERAAKGRARWVATARAAAKQSRRAFWPEVTEPASTAEVASLVGDAGLAVVLHEAVPDEPGAARLDALPVEEADSVLLVVGPEGGLTDAEVAAFAAAGAQVIRLGDSVLRTSTAGVAGAAAVLARTARWA